MSSLDFHTNAQPVYINTKCYLNVTHATFNETHIKTNWTHEYVSEIPNKKQWKYNDDILSVLSWIKFLILVDNVTLKFQKQLSMI